MRTFFEIEQGDEYQVAQELLTRRCVAWARAEGLPADPMVFAAALDSRHLSSDGRLAFWTPADVRRLLLEWIPRRVAADPAELEGVPASLVTWLRFLAAGGLLDPRGASLLENETAVAEAVEEFRAAAADPTRYGVAKFWAFAARRNGVDVTDQAAMAAFGADIEAGRADYDAQLLNRLMDEQFGRPAPGEERTFAQLPVCLPPAAELTAAVGASRVVARLQAFTEWVGADGRALTSAGNLRLADARELIGLLGTGEEELKARSAADLPQVDLIVAWAKKARLVRVSKTRLLQVAKARPLLSEPEALWQRAFEVFFDLRDAVCRPIWGRGDDTSMLHDLYGEVVPDVLNTIYSLTDPIPVARLRESVWMSCGQRYRVTAGSALQQRGWRGRVDTDLDRVFEALEALGAVEVTYGLADESYAMDLAEDFVTPVGAEGSYAREVAARLRDELAKPGQLVKLTPLGTRAMRARLLAEGREAGLVGELAGAPPAGLLGVVAEHYTAETGTVEIAGWLATHDGDPEPLLEAVRTCPFRGRAAAMLSVLTMALAEGTALLHRLRGDQVLAPLAVTALLDSGELQPDDLTRHEQVLVMTEGLLQLLELGGPDIVREQLAELPRQDQAELLEAVRISGHPAALALEEFQTLVAEPLTAGPRLLHTARQMAPGSRWRPTGRGKKGRKR
jgi:hypothetical protein